MAPVASAPEPSLAEVCLERDAVTGPVLEAQVGLVGALGGIADAHNGLVHRLQQARQQLDTLHEESGKILGRLRTVEEQLSSLPGELFVRFGKVFRPEFLGELGQHAKAQRADLDEVAAQLRGEQEEQRQSFAQILEEQVASADERRQRAIEDLEQELAPRLRVFEESLEKLSVGLRNQGNQQQQLWMELRDDFNSALPRLRSDLVARIEGLGAGLSERVDHQANRLQRTEKQIADSSAELEKLRAALEMRALESKLGPLDARLIKAEESTAAAANALAREVAQLEAHIGKAKTALCEQMQGLCEETKKAVRSEAAGVLKHVRANEGAKLSELEQRFRKAELDHGTFAELIEKEICGAREDISASRDWAAKRIEALAEEAKQLDSARQTSNDQDREAIAQQLVDMGQRQCALGRRQERCDSSIERVEQFVRALASAVDRLAPNTDLAAAVTKCLTCGRNRSLSPCARSPSPPPREEKSSLGLLQSSQWAGPAERPREEHQATRTCGPSGFRGPCSRPTSAGRRGSLEPQGIAPMYVAQSGVAAPAGAAHAACRAVGPSTPRRHPRPGSAIFRG